MLNVMNSELISDNNSDMFFSPAALKISNSLLGNLGTCVPISTSSSLNYEMFIEIVIRTKILVFCHLIFVCVIFLILKNLISWIESIS